MYEEVNMFKFQEGNCQIQGAKSRELMNSCFLLMVQNVKNH